MIVARDLRSHREARLSLAEEARTGVSPSVDVSDAVAASGAQTLLRRRRPGSQDKPPFHAATGVDCEAEGAGIDNTGPHRR